MFCQPRGTAGRVAQRREDLRLRREPVPALGPPTRCAIASVRSACFCSTTTHPRNCSPFRMTLGLDYVAILLGSYSSQAMSLRAYWIPFSH